ncbi:MAG: aconitate hydratase AcnA [Candidatus Lokiarchaeota archaeon]|nr:aconitate hydratase AcnA [Candidatus Lokiarchaeota archaeon]
MIEIQANTKEKIPTSMGKVTIYNIKKLEELKLVKISKLPYSHRILLENILRNLDGKLVTKNHLMALCKWDTKNSSDSEIAFIPTRVLLQDFTGVPAVVDLAALRSAMERAGRDPEKINPVNPVDLVIDHSIQVDFADSTNARQKNEEYEMERNRERYILLKWAQEKLKNFRVVPTSRGICHQVNLEYLGKIVDKRDVNGEIVVYPDSCIGTDSHTTMINGLSCLGWGVGGIEAEAVMLGQPYYMNIPEVVGVKLVGKLKEGITATDVVLAITEKLREIGVVEKFVEFFGPGLNTLSLPDRATIANMAPECGSTMNYFPATQETLNYLRLSGRNVDHVELVETYLKKVGLFYTDGQSIPDYNELIEFDLTSVESSLAGPKRPQDRIMLKEMKNAFRKTMKTYLDKSVELDLISDGSTLNNGSIVIAAITSCTNTSNPSVMIGAGLLARNAVQKGLKVKPFVKTSFAPGSRVVTDYMENSGLMKYLEKLGFYLVGYGCTTCIGNSGPLDTEIVRQIIEKDLAVTSVLSGNRNFEGRISPHVRANYLASPPLVVVFAIAGTVAINLEKEPLGLTEDGTPVFLKDIWPDSDEIQKLVAEYVKPDLFQEEYGEIFKGWDLWNKLETPQESVYQWDENSTYIREPPFFKDFPVEIPDLENIKEARILALLGESVTTDHISPAGSIPKDMPAGRYLIKKGVNPEDFNSFGSRRGNHEVMMRGTFGNIRIRNLLVDREGGWTIYHPTGEELPIYTAAMKYIEKRIPAVVIAGKDYGMGSSRDWAAKGTWLLGVKVVIATSYERIHRSNLVGMGVLPLQFKEGENAQSVGLIGTEKISILGIETMKPLSEIDVIAERENKMIKFKTVVRLDSEVDIEYYQNGGILHTVLRNLLKK